MKPQYSPKLTTTQNMKVAYEQGKRDMFDYYFENIEHPIVISKEQFNKLISIEEFEKMINFGEICLKLSEIKKPEKFGIDKGKIVINVEQLSLTLDIIKEQLKELKSSLSKREQ